MPQPVRRSTPSQPGELFTKELRLPDAPLHITSLQTNSTAERVQRCTQALHYSLCLAVGWKNTQCGLSLGGAAPTIYTKFSIAATRTRGSLIAYSTGFGGGIKLSSTAEATCSYDDPS